MQDSTAFKAHNLSVGLLDYFRMKAKETGCQKAFKFGGECYILPVSEILALDEGDNYPPLIRFQKVLREKMQQDDGYCMKYMAISV